MFWALASDRGVQTKLLHIGLFVGLCVAVHKYGDRISLQTPRIFPPVETIVDHAAEAAASLPRDAAAL